jgi:ABC-type multidrug transport system ATPase subunit
VSSHILAEVEQTATHIGLMHKGRLLLQSPVAALRARQTKTVQLKVDRPRESLALLQEMGIQATAQEQDRLLVTPASSEAAARDIAAINRMLVERGIRVSGVEVLEPSLEDIFVRTIERARTDPAASQQLANAA